MSRESEGIENRLTKSIGKNDQYKLRNIKVHTRN